MPAETTIDRRNRAIAALLLTTGIRVSALRTLLGKHVSMATRWICQTPPEVETKRNKTIRTFILPLDPRMTEALEEWDRQRLSLGYGDADAYFLPVRYLGHKSIGLGRRVPKDGRALPWQSFDPISRILANAANS